METPDKRVIGEQISIKTSVSGFEATIQARKSKAEMIFFSFFVFLAFPAFECAMLNDYPTASRSPGLMLLGFILFPALFLLSAYSLMWQISGEEKIQIEGQALHLKREVFGNRKFKRYPIDDFDSFKLAHTLHLRKSARLQFWGLPWQRSIAFRSGGKRVLFGQDLTEEDARALIRIIRSHFASRGETVG